MLKILRNEEPSNTLNPNNTNIIASFFIENPDKVITVTNGISPIKYLLYVPNMGICSILQEEMDYVESLSSVEDVHHSMNKLNTINLGDLERELVKEWRLLYVSEFVIGHHLTIPWGLIQKTYKYAAMDKDGSVYLFDDKPEVKSTYWSNDGKDSYISDIFCKDLLSVPDNSLWKGTLTERPKQKEEK